MSDHPATHEITEIVVLYSLGALSQHEARSFETHVSDGCNACRAELESFELTVSALALSAPEEQPPAGVRAALLTRVGGMPVAEPAVEPARTEAGPFVSILASEGRWLELCVGVLVKKLHVDHATGIATSLVKMLPGTALPIHQHLGVEQVFVIEGDCHVAGQKLKSGDYHRAEAGSIHESTYTVDGTLFLLIAPERYEVLDAR
jgi:anti-sigma factor ChrR (cupin superfamily)